MKVEEGVSSRIDFVSHEGRDLPGHAAMRIAREAAIEVQPVVRRGPFPGDRPPCTLMAGIRIRRPWISPGSSSRISSRDDDRPLIFVAVIATLHDHRRSAAMADDSQRQAGYAPGIDAVGQIGIMTKPSCLPGRSRSTVVKAVEEHPGRDVTTHAAPHSTLRWRAAHTPQASPAAPAARTATIWSNRISKACSKRLPMGWVETTTSALAL